MLSWFRALTDRPGRTALAGRRPRFRPRVDVLEDRELPVAGALDPTFGQSGILPVALRGAVLGSAGVALAPGNAVVLAGLQGNGSLTVARLTSAGRFDGSFGSGGITVVPEGLRQVNGVAVTAAGQVLTLGRNGAGQFVVTRFTRAGRLDPTFGRGGVSTFAANINSLAGLALAPGNRVVVAGSTGDGRLDVARLAGNGRLDPRFGSGGQTFVSAPTGTLVAGGGNGVAVDRAGQVVVAATNLANASRAAGNFFVARLTSAGRLDARFGTNGSITFGTGQNRGTAVVVQGSQYVVGGVNGNGLAAARLTSAGRLDSGFGSNGTLTFLQGLGTPSTSVSLSLAPGSRIVAAGAVNDNFGVARLTSAGQLDRAFAGGGQLLVAPQQVRNAAGAQSTLPQATVAGNGLSLTQGSTSPFSVGLTGTNVPGTGVPLLSPGGQPTNNAGATPVSFAVPQSNTGTSASNPTSLLTNGTFAQAGTISGAALLPGGLVVLPDGRIVIAGTLSRSSSNQVIVERLLGS